MKKFTHILAITLMAILGLSHISAAPGDFSAAGSITPEDGRKEAVNTPKAMAKAVVLKAVQSQTQNTAAQKKPNNKIRNVLIGSTVITAATIAGLVYYYAKTHPDFSFSKPFINIYKHFFGSTPVGTINSENKAPNLNGFLSHQNGTCAPQDAPKPAYKSNGVCEKLTKSEDYFRRKDIYHRFKKGEKITAYELSEIQSILNSPNEKKLNEEKNKVRPTAQLNNEKSTGLLSNVGSWLKEKKKQVVRWRFNKITKNGKIPLTEQECKDILSITPDDAQYYSLHCNQYNK